MTIAQSIIYAANARGTHHKLALDALDHLSAPEAESWRRLFYKYAGAFVQGSKAPDEEFKDFQNHVLHVRDGYWGGAAEKVENWYAHLVKELQGERWKEAAWAAGVLSHYYTDPIHPFHTAQSEAENSIHRAAEWSINRSYDALADIGRRDFSGPAPKPGDGPGWLKAFVVEGAETGNHQYEKLIAHYDIHSGVVDPPSGLDDISRRLVAQLIIYATRGLAAVLDRAIAEAGVRPPEVNLTLDAAAAIASMPRKWMLSRIENAAEMRVIEAMYDELKATGKVDLTLPEDDKVVRDFHAREVLEPLLAARAKERDALVAQPSRYERGYAVATAQTAIAPPAPAHLMGQSAASPAAVPLPAHIEPARAQPVPAAHVASPPAQDTGATPLQAVKDNVVPVHFAGRDEGAPRVYLNLADDVERAPSIGPKMAERLYAHGVKTVADLLAADADALSLALDAKNVWDETIVDWKDQARLVCDVPGLRGTHAQLLVGAGYRTRNAIAAAAPEKLCADVLAFAVSTEGNRVLRDGNPPDIERIKGWLASAKAAKVA